MKEQVYIYNCTPHSFLVYKKYRIYRKDLQIYHLITLTRNWKMIFKNGQPWDLGMNSKMEKIFQLYTLQLPSSALCIIQGS